MGRGYSPMENKGTEQGVGGQGNSETRIGTRRLGIVREGNRCYGRVYRQGYGAGMCGEVYAWTTGNVGTGIGECAVGECAWTAGNVGGLGSVREGECDRVCGRGNGRSGGEYDRV